MGIEYKLGKTGSGNYQELACDEKSDAIVRDISMFGFGDAVSFRKVNSRHPTGEPYATFGSDWTLCNLACFKELRGYTRLIDMPKRDVKRLAARIYELLYMHKEKDKKYYNTKPKIDETKPKYKQILEELTILKETQRSLVESGEINFPEISDRELALASLW